MFYLLAINVTGIAICWGSVFALGSYLRWPHDDWLLSQNTE